MAGSRENHSGRRANKENGRNAGQAGGQYYQNDYNQQGYQQNRGGYQGQYQQGNPGAGYQQGNPGAGYQQGNPGAGYQQGGAGYQGQYQQNPYGQQGYYQQNPYGQQGYYQQNPYGQQGNYQRTGGSRRAYDPQAAAAEKRKKKKGKRRILFVLELILLLVLAAGLYGAATLAKLDRVEIKDKEIAQQVQEQLPEYTAQKMQGYWNIALYGVDSRDANEYGQSDTIIVCSINKDTKEVKLASVYRDSYLDSGDGTFRKATDVYAIYGVERSISMLNKNLDLDISDFMTVNMNLVAEVVNDLGGIEIDVREDEVDILNGYQNEGSKITGLEIVPVTGPGLQTLNGLQAMSYCRIRYTVPIDDVHQGLDYERTLRQRVVLEKILEKVQKLDPVTLTGMVNDLVGYISTSLSTTEILSLAKDVASYRLVETTGFPFDKQTGDTDAGDCVIPVNMAENVRQLHEFLFENQEYTPSETVQSISNEIAYRTGIS